MTTDQSSTSMLFQAFRERNLEEVIKVLSRGGVDINITDENQWTALHYSCYYGNEEIVKLLLSCGAKVDAKSVDEWEPLHHAVKNSLGIVKQLVLAGANVNAVTTQDKYTPLHNASTRYDGDQVVKYLLSLPGTKVEECTITGKTALHVASEDGSVGAMKELLSFGANVMARDDQGKTPLHWARATGECEDAKSLLSYGADIMARDNREQTPLHTVLFHPGNDAPSVTQLVALGADVDAADGEGWTPLHTACKPETWTKVGSLHCRHVFVQLLASGANVNAVCGKTGDTPLHLAIANAYFGFGEIGALQLVSRGANLLALNSNGETALEIGLKFACSYPDYGEESMRDNLLRLISTQSSAATTDAPISTTTTGMTPLHIASLVGHVGVIRGLVSHDVGADMIQATDHQGRTPLHAAASQGHSKVVHILVDSGANIKAVDNEGRTPLHSAASQDRSEVYFWSGVSFFVSSGANMEAVDNEGKTPLHLSSRREQNIYPFRDLVTNGANIMARDNREQTPLHVTSSAGVFDMVVDLLSLGAELNATDMEGRTSLHYASMNGHWDVVILLLNSGANVLMADNNDRTSLDSVLDAWEEALCSINLVYAVVHGLVPGGVFG